MRCASCNEEYDFEMFSICPFCLVENKSESAILHSDKGHGNDSNDCLTNQTTGFKEEDSNISQKNSDKNSQNEDIDVKPVKFVDKFLIEDYFTENIYTIFRIYCADNNIVYVEDLEFFDFSKLQYIPHLGTKKIESIITKYEMYSNSSFIDENKLRSVSKDNLMFTDIHDDYMEIPLDMLTVFGMKSIALGKLNNIGIEKVMDLKGVKRSKVCKLLREKNVAKLEIIENIVKLSVKESMEYFLDQSSSEEDYFMTLKKSNGYTLQEIGDQVGITRERVRQLIKLFCKKLDYFMGFIIKDLDYFKNDLILDFYENDDFDKILLYWCKSNEKYEYLDFAELFLIRKEAQYPVENILLGIVKEFIGDGINFYDYLEESENLMKIKGYPYIDANSFINLAEKYGCRFYGDFLAPKHLSYGLLCARLISKKYPNGIKLYNGKELDDFRKLVAEEYGDLQVSDEDRAFTSRVSAYLILRGRGEFITPDKVYIENSLLNEIKDYIDSQSECNIYYTELYSKFEGPLNLLSNIDNYNFLHGVLTMYFPNEYKYTRDYLIKENIISNHVSLADKIRDIVKEKKCPIHKNTIKARCTGFSDAMIFYAIASDPYLFQWEWNVYSSLEIIEIQENDKNKLITIIDELLLEFNGIISDEILYNKVKEKHYSFLEKNQIVSSSNLFYIYSKILFNEYDFRTPIITTKNLIPEITIKSTLLYILNNPEVLSLEEYNKICRKLGISEISSSLAFTEITKDYSRISQDEYVIGEKLNIASSDIEIIRTVIARKIRNNILSISQFDEWHELPKVEFKWNKFLFRTIIEEYIDEYLIVESKAKDRRYEKGIVVLKNLDVTNYIDLVIYYLIEIGKTEISEGDMLSILLLNGLTLKIIPKELYTTDRLIFKNGIFKIKSEVFNNVL